MGRPAKCRYCQNNLKIETRYKTVIDNKTAYFCNEEHFLLFKTRLDEEKQKKELNRKQGREKIGRSCTCKVCKKSLNTLSAWYTIVDDKKVYCCSQDEYENYIKIKEKKAKDYYEVEGLIAEIFGYKVENTSLHKEWERWRHLADDEKIASYLKENKNYLCNMMSKCFPTEYSKIRYFSSILCNNLVDFVSNNTVVETPKPKVQVEEYIYEPEYTGTRSNKRRSLVDLEDEF